MRRLKLGFLIECQLTLFAGTGAETLTLDGNFLTGRAPAEICNLRNDNLTKLTVGCPQQVNSVLISGIICSIPSCCTQCF